MGSYHMMPMHCFFGPGYDATGCPNGTNGEFFYGDLNGTINGELLQQPQEYQNLFEPNGAPEGIREVPEEQQRSDRAESEHSDGDIEQPLQDGDHGSIRGQVAELRPDALGVVLDEDEEQVADPGEEMGPNDGPPADHDGFQQIPIPRFVVDTTQQQVGFTNQQQGVWL